MDDLTDKTMLRAKLRKLRRALAAQAPDAARDAAARLPLTALPPIAAFSLYHPMGAELDPRPLLAVLSHAQAALPVATHRDAPLDFRVWRPDGALEPDAFGILAPTAEAASVIPDLVFAPVLGFDRAGNRLGQGAGHYDRTLAALRAIRPIFVIGLAYAGQEVAVLPAEPHDEKLDAILTETGYRAFA